MSSRWTPLWIVGAAALVAVVVAGLLPWRSDEVSGFDSLLEAARRRPAVLVLYGIALLSTAATVVVAAVRPGARLGTLALSAVAMAAALAAMIVLPLPEVRVYGSTRDGTFVEWNVSMVRSWGCYLTVLATAVGFGARALAARR